MRVRRFHHTCEVIHLLKGVILVKCELDYSYYTLLAASGSTVVKIVLIYNKVHNAYHLDIIIF